MSKIHDLTKTLEGYLRHQMPHAANLKVQDLWRSPGGSSRVTWLFNALWEEAGVQHSQGMVMRSGQSWVYRDSEVSLEQETRVAQALHGSVIPVAKVFWYETDLRWLGQPFSIAEKLRGSPNFIFDNDERKARVTRRYAELLAAQHTLDWEKCGLSFLGVPQDPANCALRQINLWEGVIKRELLEPSPIACELASWLRRHAPTEVSRISLNHGDPGPGNFFFEGDEITGVLDWEQAFLGDPMADLGNLVASRGKALGDLNAFFATYEALSGIPVRMESVQFYAAFMMFFGMACCGMARHKFCNSEIKGLESGFSHGVTLLDMVNQHFGDLLTKVGNS